MRLRAMAVAAAAVLLSLTVAPAGRAAPDAEPAALQAQEQTVLQELFTLGRKLEETRAALSDLDTKAAALTRQEAGARAERERLEAELRRRQAQLGDRVRFIREQGQIAPLAVLLGSGSLADFMGRLDIISTILRRDNRLIHECQELADAVAARELEIRRAAAELERVRADLAAARTKLEQDIAQRELLLAGLRERREAVERELAGLEQLWQERALPVLVSLGTTLQQLDAADFEPDSIALSLFPPGAVATVSGATLDRFFARRAELKGLSVRVRPGEVRLEGEFDGAAVAISGRFSVASKTVLRYEPREVLIREFKVPPEALQNLLAGGALDIDVAAMVSPFALQDVTMLDGELRIRAGLR